METTVRWRDWDGQGIEHCVCREDDGELVLEGVVAGTRGGRYGAHYIVRADAEFGTRDVRVDYVAGPRLHVSTDGAGHWRDRIGGGALPMLDGCLDVDIGVTPATNTLPIRRLKLSEHESRDIVVAYVPLPHQIDGTFLPTPARQRYTCLRQDRLYRYDGLFRAFSAELEVDAFGLVLDYPDTFRREGAA
jgi:hypothetical protein